jgi:radical SAM protein with 4Fe4S-binding SPASM domain
MKTYADFPAVIVWEMTRACRLACRHCRAVATSEAHPSQLATSEGYRLIDQVAQARPQLLILTGGDPSRRPDLMEMIGYASAKGLRVALSPSATPDFLMLDFRELREAGVRRVSLSLDGATEEAHNAFRGVKRAWRWTMDAAHKLREAGLAFQINSTITSANLSSFDELASVVEGMEPAGWTIFLVVPTGRAGKDLLPDPAEVEVLFGKLVEMSRRVRFEIRTTEGQHYRRVLLQSGALPSEIPAPVNDGKGFLFLSHIGEICPSGFLPLVAGNVRTHNVLATYRHSPVFTRLRNPQNLKGKCGRCAYQALCGGSRARAFGLTGDPFAEDPLCAYQPGEPNL